MFFIWFYDKVSPIFFEIFEGLGDGQVPGGFQGKLS